MKPDGETEDREREARLAAALRDNLRRRKAQAREAGSATVTPPDHEDDPRP